MLPGVELLAVELRRIRLPLVVPFRTSSSTMTARDILLLRVSTPDHVGWGECAALNEPFYSSEWVDGAHEVLRRFLVPALLAGGRLGPTEVAARLAFVKGHPMAKAALEMAVLDASLRDGGTSLASYLGGARSRVEVGVSVGIVRPVEALVAAVEEYHQAGYRRVKLKIEPGWDIEPVNAVRRHLGPDMKLQVDANGAYRPSDIAHLGGLDAFDLLMIEQPFGVGDLTGHAELAAAIATPVCLDESIESAGDAIRAIDAGACSVVNVKPGRVGGYLEARRIHDVCVERHVDAWCGGMLETGLGRAANLALASMPGFTLPGDISASDRYYRPDLTEPLVLEDGEMAVPPGPGIGVVPRAEILERTTTAVMLLTP